jgi:hypothetical protein
MRLGFTGTRAGMTAEQRAAFIWWLHQWMPDEFHHGDCVGSDDESATIVHVEIPKCKIVCHPPIDTKLRAYNTFHQEIREPKTHFARNRDIVDETDKTVGTPREIKWQPRGGTWYTLDYAIKCAKPPAILWPNGTRSDPTTRGAS